MPHIHLLLNHFPTVGFSVGLALFFVALLTKSDDLKKASLAIFFLIGLTTIAVYVTGSAAELAIQNLPDVSKDMIVKHADAALVAFVFMQITGALAFIALWQYRRISRPAPGMMPAILVLSIVTFGLMANVATIGGDIRHPEIMSADEATAPVTPSAFQIGWLTNASVGHFILGHDWAWPTSETLHFVGLCLLFTVVLLVDLRMLGMAKRLSFGALHRLLPLGLLGFGVNVVTGMAFFISSPGQYTRNVAFHWKIALILLAGLNTLYFMLVDEPWEVGPGDDAPLRAKVVAASAIFLWLGVLFCGHMLPFIGNAF